MKIGVIYATNRNEATVQIVQWMKSELENLGHKVISGKINEISDLNCDYYIIGTAVYMFSAKRAGIIKFIKKNRTEFEKKPASLFVVCCSTKLPPKNKAKDGMIKKFFKYNLINPDKYLESVSTYLPEKPLHTINFSGYNNEEYKAKFPDQKKVVREWIKEINLK